MASSSRRRMPSSFTSFVVSPDLMQRISINSFFLNSLMAWKFVFHLVQCITSCQLAECHAELGSPQLHHGTTTIFLNGPGASLKNPTLIHPESLIASSAAARAKTALTAPALLIG